MTDEATRTLLGRFAADLSEAVPLTALWAHGSLALGDYVPGRSDLDLVALIDAPAADGQRQDLQRIHQSLIRDEPLAAGLHCAYLVESERDDPERSHLTWAHAELFERPVSPVSRRELHRAACACSVPPRRSRFPRSPTPSWPATSAATCATTGIRTPAWPTCGCTTSGWTWGC